MKCEAIFKATKVDGIYDKDPILNPEAKYLDEITYDTALQENLKVMDATALTLARDHAVPINVFNVNKTHALKSIICGKKIGTLIS